MKNLEIGTAVKVNTQIGIIEGIICPPCGYGNENQFWVSYKINANGYIMPFSKKTGKAYGNNPAKREGHFIIF